jgi:hypothetical protein
MRERGDEDGRGIIAVAERSGIEPWRDQFYNEHSDTLVTVSSHGVAHALWRQLSNHRDRTEIDSGLCQQSAFMVAVLSISTLVLATKMPE